MKEEITIRQIRGRAKNRLVGDGAIDGGRRVIRGPRLLVILGFSVSGLAIDRDRRSRGRDPDNIDRVRYISARNLIQGIVSVIGEPEAGAHSIASRLGRVPIPNVIESILQLLASHWCPVSPVFLARSHLAEGIVSIDPVTAVRQLHVGALVGGVVGVRVGLRQRGRRRQGRNG